MMKIRAMMARKGDTPEYVSRMQQEIFDVMAKARSLDELRMVEPVAREVRSKYMDGLRSVDVKDLAIHQRWSTIREDVKVLCGTGISGAWISSGSWDGDRIRCD